MDELEKSLVSVEKEITCAVCHDHYQQPKVLPCLHFYCKECILKLALRAGTDQPFPCPECRKETSLPEGNVDNLQTAVFINRLKDQYTQLEKALSKEVKCEMCSTSEALAEAFCRQCNMFACIKCVESHQRMKALFGRHEIISLDEVKKSGFKVLPVKISPAKECGRHKKSLDIFCLDCKELICRDCTIKDHRDHDFEFNHIEAVNKKKELMDSLEPLREMEGRLCGAVEEIKRAQLQLEAQAVSVANNINTSFEELHVILERRKQQLLEEARREVNSKITSFKRQEEKMSTASAEVRSIIDYTEQCVRHCSDDEVMCMHAEIGSRIQEEIEGQGQPGRIIPPVEQVEVGTEVRCAEAQEQLCQTRAKIVIGCPFIKVNKVASNAEINEISEVRMSIFPNKPDTPVYCRLNSLYNGPLIECDVQEIGAGEYCIQYTPTVRGRHELSISVDGQPVAGSPFPVLVCSPPTLIDKPVKVWDGFKEPFGLTVNSVGEIIVAEYGGGGDVVVMDRDGTRLRSVNSSDHQFKHLLSVAVDSEDNIYFTDETNRIFKSNKNCREVRVHKVKQVKGPGHYDVAVVGDEVMVTECCNKGVITVYSRELKYVRQIVGANNTTLRGLCPDSHQNVYVCDSSNSVIQVYSKDGEFLRSFGCDENGVRRLKSPWGVCVAGQYMYVAYPSVRKIVVFTTEGDYVTSCGDYRSVGVCVDQDGFVYVTDYHHSKINIY